jgi:starvation-inducible DNA-binding protein
MADYINTDAPSKQDLAKSLAVLLSDVVTMHYLAHGSHWNVKGPLFSQFHEFFGEIYEDVAGSEDDIAESIKRLGYDAPYLLQQFQDLTGITAVENQGDPVEMSAILYDANLVVLGSLDLAFGLASILNQQGIANTIAGRIEMHTKWSWQLGTTIGANLAGEDADAELEGVEVGPDADVDVADDMAPVEGIDMSSVVFSDETAESAVAADFVAVDSDARLVASGEPEEEVAPEAE